MITTNDIKTVKTTKGTLHYYRDWDRSEGGIVMKDAQTLKRYKEIQNQHPDADECGVFFAFDEKQFDEGYKRLVENGKIKDGDEVKYDPETVMYGTDEGIGKYFKFYRDRDRQVAKECDPQEVYFYEYNNYESMYAWDGDSKAMRLIIEYWGVDVAKAITRFTACKKIEDLTHN